jgi:hypothetical protein
MLTKIKLALAATLILGSATVALADESGSLDNALSAPQQQVLTTRPVALSHTQAPKASGQYFDRASQVFDGGGR